MDWQAIGAVGQLLGSVAVLVTLVYLAVQVRLARDDVRRSASRSRAESLREMIVATRLTNAPLTALNTRINRALGSGPNPFVTSLVEQTGASEEEAILLHWEQLGWFQSQTENYLLLNELTPGEVASFEGNTRRVYGGTSVGALWYRTMKDSLNPEVVAYIDELLARPSTHRQ